MMNILCFFGIHKYGPQHIHPDSLDEPDEPYFLEECARCDADRVSIPIVPGSDVCFKYIEHWHREKIK